MKALSLFLVVVALAGSASAATRTVTLDVKDGEARDVLKSMQAQCAVKNLIVDPDVAGKGTFFFRGVPCETAFRVVFRTLGLAGQYEPDLVTVERR